MILRLCISTVFIGKTWFKLLELYPFSPRNVKGKAAKKYGSTTHKHMFMCGTFVYYMLLLFNRNERDIKNERRISRNRSLRLRTIGE